MIIDGKETTIRDNIFFTTHNGNAVYEFIQKKMDEGKPSKVAKIAGFNKFLQIYYARVMEVYQ